MPDGEVIKSYRIIVMYLRESGQTGKNMGIEIERKFLLKDSTWKEDLVGKHYCQGYLSRGENCTVRVRTVEEKAFLTVKGRTQGFSRHEYEYEIPVSEGREMLESLCGRNRVEKYRYLFSYRGMVWEIDEFLGANAGLVVAEIELESEDQIFAKPPWLAEEVTGDARYYNACLASRPFCVWT